MRICERSRSFGSFEVAVVLVEHPEHTAHVGLPCAGAGQAGTKPEPFLPSSRLALMGYMDIEEGVLRKWQCSDLH